MERYQVVGHLRLDPEGTVTSYADAQATVEALQRERDELKELTSVICGHCCEPMAIPSRAVLQAALDAEREKAAQQGRYAVDLFDEIQRMKKAWCEERAGFESDLVKAEIERDKLQALVRAWGTAHESVDDWFRRAATDENTPTISEFEAVKKVLFDSERALKATLDATTPAPETSIIGKCVPPSQYDPNAQVRGDIS